MSDIPGRPKLSLVRTLGILAEDILKERGQLGITFTRLVHVILERHRDELLPLMARHMPGDKERELRSVRSNLVLAEKKGYINVIRIPPRLELWVLPDDA